MDRIKMALGIVVGAVLLQLAFMACSGNTPGIMGGSDAAAQTTPACTQWEVKWIGSASGEGEAMSIEMGWEPFTVLPTTPRRHTYLRRCIAR